MFKTIKTKITGTVLLILFSVFAVQLAANYLFAKEFYVSKKSKLMTKAYNEISAAADLNSDAAISDLMSIYEEEGNLQFILANQEYECIYNSKQYSFSSNKHNYKIRSPFDFEKRIGRFTVNPEPVYKERENGRDRMIMYGIIEREQGNYYMIIRTSLQAINNDMKNTNRFVLIISFIAVIVGGVLSYFLSKRLAKPIEEIDKVAISVSSLDFSLKAKEYGENNELDRLAKNINLMSENLENSIEQLREANHKLELDNQYMENLNEARKELVANVSHELKTPLAVLTGYVEMLQSNNSVVDKDFYYSVILDEVNHMTSLVQKLLDVSVVENEPMNLELETINATQFIQNLLERNYILFEQKDLKCSFRPDKEYVLRANRMYLERAVMNYITNAIRHTKNGHEISISLEDRDPFVRITVFNEGNHIENNVIEHIWDSFYRCDKARTRTEDHCIGLGLYLVSVIMEKHGGTYGVENREGGVAFWLDFKK